MSNQLDYPAMPTRQLRARFAVRALGWRWLVYDDGSALLISPEDATKWPCHQSTIIEDDWPRKEPHHRYDRDLYLQWDTKGADPRIFSEAEHPHPGAWYNVGRVLEAMRERDWDAVLDVDADRFDVMFCNGDPKMECINHEDPDPERAALVSAMRALDAEAAQDAQVEARESESEAHDA